VIGLLWSFWWENLNHFGPIGEQNISLLSFIYHMRLLEALMVSDATNSIIVINGIDMNKMNLVRKLLLYAQLNMLSLCKNTNNPPILGVHLVKL
jgi:hypothetical protein